jgi:hypothetical protein
MDMFIKNAQYRYDFQKLLSEYFGKINAILTIINLIYCM